MQSIIKTLDWSYYRTGGSVYKEIFVKTLTEAFTSTGFFLLDNHGISPRLLSENRRLWLKFFKELPLEARMKYAHEELSYQVGYTPMGIETGEFATVADNKHFFQIGDMYDSLFISEIPALKEVSQDLYEQFADLYKLIMRAVARSLDLELDYFDDTLGNSIARMIHYPENANPTVDDDVVMKGGNILGMCASQHTDINDITLLHAIEPGLQLKYNNQWIDVLCKPETVIVNVGDMLEHLTGGLYKSGAHRVVCQPGVERFSCPFFGHRIDEASIVPLAKLGTPDLVTYSFKTEGEYLAHRLKQINLKK